MTFDKQQLSNLSNETGFLRDNLEKVIRLSDILDFISQDSLLSEKLVLKGGTAINLTVFQMPRLSVDIDLDYDDDCSREEMLAGRKAVSSILLAYMENQGYVLTSDSKSPHSLDSWVFNYINAAGNRDNIKIEINYSMRCHIYPPVRRSITIPFLDKLSVQALDPLELFSSKIKALVERCACRDLYDVANMVHASVFKDQQLPLLRKCVLFYLAVGGSHQPQHTYTFESIQSIQYRQIRATLIPVLRKRERFDYEEAKDTVIRFLSNLLDFTPSEMMFIDKFNSGEYSPDLLFDDKAVLSRISNHPMAIWKTKS